MTSRRSQALPVLVGEPVDVLQEDGAVLLRLRAGLGVVCIDGPFEAGVADVDGQEAHGGPGA